MTAIEDGAMQDKADDLVDRAERAHKWAVAENDHIEPELVAELAAELTQLRERNAELEKDYVQKSETANLLLSSCHLMESRIASLETIIDANDQLIDGYVARIASLEATVREMREALLKAGKCIALYSPGDRPAPLANYMFKIIDAALASSESVVKSEGEKYE